MANRANFSLCFDSMSIKIKRKPQKTGKTKMPELVILLNRQSKNVLHSGFSSTQLMPREFSTATLNALRPGRLRPILSDFRHSST